MRTYWILCIVVTTAYAGCVPYSDRVKHSTFITIDPESFTPYVPKRLIDPGRDKVTNDVACALKTRMVAPTSKGFFYNKASDLCSPITLEIPDTSQLQDTTAEEVGNLYWDTCMCPGKFQLFRITPDHLPICLYISSEKGSYHQASEFCRASAAHLASVKTVSKLNLLNTLVDGETWVGLDDLEQEGVFVWQEDGTLLTREQQISVFNPGEPNNGGGANEDCVLINGPMNPLNDNECVRRLSFICEFPINETIADLLYV